MVKVDFGKDLSVYYDGYLIDILNTMKKAIEKHNTSIVLIIDGRSGKGKTTISNQIALYLDNNYSIDNIYYNPDTFLEGLANAKKGDFLLFDEAMLISSRSALSRVNKMIIQSMSMIRSKNLYIGFCVNSVFDLDKNLALSRADCLVHVYGEGLFDRGRFATFFKSPGDNINRLKGLYLNGKKYYSYTKPRANFYGKFTKEFIVDEIEYEKRKQTAINKFLRQQEIPQVKFERDVYIKRAKELKIKLKTICKLFDISQMTIYNIDKTEIE